MEKKSLKTILGNGIALAIPLLILVYVLSKIVGLLEKSIEPLAAKLGMDTIFGEFTLSILALIVIVILVFLLGVLMQFTLVNALRNSIESVIIRFFPSLNNFKAVLADQFNTDMENTTWKSVVLQQGSKYNFAFLVEESESIGVFFVLSQGLNSGSPQYLTRGEYKYYPVDSLAMRKCLKQTGVGGSALIEKTIKGA